MEENKNKNDRKAELIEKKRKKMESKKSLVPPKTEVPVMISVPEAEVKEEIISEQVEDESPIYTEKFTEDEASSSNTLEHNIDNVSRPIGDIPRVYDTMTPPPAEYMVSVRNTNNNMVDKAKEEPKEKLRIDTSTISTLYTSIPKPTVDKSEKERAFPNGLPAKYEIWVAGNKVYDTLKPSGSGVVLHDSYLFINGKKYLYKQINIISK
jgi:hypothetical protein